MRVWHSRGLKNLRLRLSKTDGTVLCARAGGSTGGTPVASGIAAPCDLLKKVPLEKTPVWHNLLLQAEIKWPNL